MTTAVIVDDELSARENLGILLKEHCDDVKVVGVAGKVEDAVGIILEMRPELLFLDIEIAEGSGFDVLKRLPDIDCEVIFITAFNQYAIKAFKFSAIDYLLKPVDIDELVSAVSRAKKRLPRNERNQVLEQLLTNLFEKDKKVKRIGLPVQAGIHFYHLEEIIRLQSQSNYTTFHLTRGREVLVSKTLKEFEELLCEQGFARIHQSHIINMEHIVQYIKSDGGYVILSDNSNVPISKNYKDHFLELLSKF